MVEVVFVRWILRWISLPLLSVVLRHKTEYHRFRSHGAVLRLHGHGVLHILLVDRFHWLLCLPMVCAEDLRCHQGRLRVLTVPRVWLNDTYSRQTMIDVVVVATVWDTEHSYPEHAFRDDQVIIHLRG